MWRQCNVTADTGRLIRQPQEGRLIKQQNNNIKMVTVCMCVQHEVQLMSVSINIPWCSGLPHACYCVCVLIKLSSAICTLPSIFTPFKECKVNVRVKCQLLFDAFIRTNCKSLHYHV